MNIFDKFSDEIKKVLDIAEQESLNEGLNYIGTEHLLIGILNQHNSLGNNILNSFGINLKSVRIILKKSTPEIHKSKNFLNKKNMLDLSDFAKQSLENAIDVAYKYNHALIGTEHLLIGLMQQKGTAATTIIQNMKIAPIDIINKTEDLFQQMNKYQPNMMNSKNSFDKFMANLNGILFSVSQDPNLMVDDGLNQPNMGFNVNNKTVTKKKVKQSDTPALDYFTLNLTNEAKLEKLEPVIGRDKEIERIIHILNRKTKNNPVLIGEPGVGKTAVVEGLAQKIAKENIPMSLFDKKILFLDMGALIAGTKYRGEFEMRMKKVIDEIQKLEDEIILFIDEIHTIVGAGSSEGSLDAANILKPVLGRGKIQIIGATTIKEYRKHIEKDPALERRLQPVFIDEPSINDAENILQGLKSRFEDYHNLNIANNVISETVRLANMYISDRYLPDKAIDLLDEAMAYKSMKSYDGNNNALLKLKKKLLKIQKEKEHAVAREDFENANKLRHQEILLESKIGEIKKNNLLPKSQRKDLDVDDINRTVSLISGVPVDSLSTCDSSNLLNLEKKLSQYIVGQDEVIKVISKALRRNKVGISDSDRPIGSFLFLGPTGVGKTELVKILAKEVYGKEDALIRIDMSEFMERHNVSRLIGSTPGYVGYEEGGGLTEAVRKRPYSVVLFDEVEKAHPEVFNILLQIMDDGHITDSKGRKINFKNTIVILTSNYKSNVFNHEAKAIGFDLCDESIKKELNKFNEIADNIKYQLKDIFSPEFLNRLDSTIVFKPLNKKDIEKIVKLELKKLVNRIAIKGVRVQLSDSLFNFLTFESYNPKFGARNVKRKIQEYIEDYIANLFLENKISEGDNIKIYYKKDIYFKKLKNV